MIRSFEGSHTGLQRGSCSFHCGSSECKKPSWLQRNSRNVKTLWFESIFKALEVSFPVSQEATGHTAWNSVACVAKSSGGQVYLEMASSTGGMKDWMDRSWVYGHEVEQEKRSEGSQMPGRGWTMEVKLWNHQQRLHRFALPILFDELLSLHLGGTSMR